MANDFLTNLRAARGNQQKNTSKTLPTRGDLQKQRQTEPSSDAFVNFLRKALGMPTIQKEKEPLTLENVSPQNIDKASPETEREQRMTESFNRYLANQGNLDATNDLNKFNAAYKGTLDAPLVHSDFDQAFGVLNNYDALNKVLDEYDAINTWSGKRRFLEDTYKKFDDKYGDIAKWFDRLYGFTLEAQDFGEWDTKKVTDAMRRLNDNIKKMLLRKS